MALERQRRQFTVEEYHRMAEAGVFGEHDRVELIRGEILMMTPAGPRHSYFVRRVNRVLVRAVGDRAEISVQDPVQVEARSEPEPDIAVLRPRGREYLTEHPQRGDVLLAVEVADSSLHHDREVKIPLYSEAGIPEAWLLDVENLVVERYTDPRPDGYARLERLHANDHVELVALAGCRIDLSQILG